MTDLRLAPSVAAKYAAIVRTRMLGGPGSGNFGHGGRPGEVGGSTSEAPPMGILLKESRGLETAFREQAGVSGSILSATVGQRVAVKEQIVIELSKRGVDPVFAQSKLDLWADTSGDHQDAAVRMQNAVAQEFALEHVAMEHLPKTDDPLEEELAFVRAEYENTQQWFKDHGITHISVYRGQGATTRIPADALTVGMQPASSWTTDHATAMDFAIEAGGNHEYVLTTRVPVERVLSTCVSGRGCLIESEVILLGGRLHVALEQRGVDE